VSVGYDSSICERFKRCKVCYKQYRPEQMEKHKCGFKKCTLCKKEVEATSKFLYYIQLMFEQMI